MNKFGIKKMTRNQEDILSMAIQRILGWLGFFVRSTNIGGHIAKQLLRI